MKKLLEKLHHSVSDWDFSEPIGFWNLRADDYVSPPTSLRLVHTTAGTRQVTVTCRHPSTLCLPEGEVRSWRRTDNENNNVFSFRNQVALGSSNYLNCYLIYLQTTNGYLRRYVDGESTSFPMGASGGIGDVWQHYRVVYWNGSTPEGAPALAVKLYLEIDSEWVQQGITAYDPYNQYADSHINRSGLIMQATNGRPEWEDDTEIWGPV